MYLGLVLCLLGWALLLGCLVPFVVVPAFFALIHFRLVEREEPFMPSGPMPNVIAVARP